MKKTVKKIAAGVVSLCLVFLLAGCGGQLQSYRPIDNVENLGGRKIAVTAGYAADYLLTYRDGKDMFLYRYDTNADMLMALCYRQVDAMVVDSVTWQLVSSTNKGLHRVEQPLAHDGSVLYANPAREDLRDAFNVFIASYKETPAYADLTERLSSFDGTNYEYHPKELTGTGEKVIFAYDMACYPFCFTTADGEMQGFELELMIDFANANNYQVEIIPTGETDIYTGVAYGKYDAIFGQLSIAYAEEAEMGGYPLSDPYFERPLYLVEVDDLGEMDVAAMADQME